MNATHSVRSLLTCTRRGCDTFGSATGEALDLAGVGCPSCGTTMRVTEIAGRFTDQGCNSACMFAKGPDCECGCGGGNHAAGHLMMLVALGGAPELATGQSARSVVKVQGTLF